MKLLFLLLACFATAAAAQTPLTAGEIMARVAANQDQAQKLRKEYIYHQHVHVATRLTDGKLRCEQTDDYEVIPTPDGTKKELKSRTGRFWQKRKYVDFSGKSAEDIDDGLDTDLTSDFADDLVNDKSKDGLAKNLFPLTTEQQSKYTFKLQGESEQDGRAVYRIGFSPTKKGEVAWAGEALIDKQDFQPVLVYTKLNRKLPLFVRGMLGTDLPGIGFSVHYRRQPDGVWFPVSFGTEFRLKAVFFIKRDISLSLDNRDFRHTHVDTRIIVPGQK